MSLDENQPLDENQLRSELNQLRVLSAQLKQEIVDLRRANAGLPPMREALAEEAGRYLEAHPELASRRYDWVRVGAREVTLYGEYKSYLNDFPPGVSRQEAEAALLKGLQSRNNKWWRPGDWPRMSRSRSRAEPTKKSRTARLVMAELASSAARMATGMAVIAGGVPLASAIAGPLAAVTVRFVAGTVGYGLVSELVSSRMNSKGLSDGRPRSGTRTATPGVTALPEATFDRRLEAAVRQAGGAPRSRRMEARAASRISQPAPGRANGGPFQTR